MRAALFIPLLAIGCIDASVSEPVICKSMSVDFGVAPSVNVGVDVPASYSVTQDFSPVMGKLSDIGTVDLSVSSNDLSSPAGLAWLDSLDISFERDNQTILVASYKNGVNQALPANGNLFAMLSSGAVTVHFDAVVSGTPSKLNDDLCMSAAISRSLP